MVAPLVLAALLPLQSPSSSPPSKAPRAGAAAAPSAKARPGAPTTTDTPVIRVPVTLPVSLPPSFGTTPVTFTSMVTVQVPRVPVPPARPAATTASLAQGRRLYQQRCAACHGDTGAADGVGARRIQPEPQHLDAVIWQANVSDDEIKKAILLGGAAVSRSPMMPANPDLKDKPAVVQSLVAYVRSLRAPFGSVVGSLSLADKTSRAAHAAADKAGNATLVFADVPRGKALITVMVDGDGTVGCTLDVDVQQDTTLTCP
jgi:mono/diheme cytochrome c family protein